MKSSMMQSGTASQRWMIVDDNPQFLELLRQAAVFFTDREIECFAEPRAALAAFEAEPDAFEFVITDFEMPGLNGFELCRRLRETAPTLKVLLATGSWELDEEKTARHGFCGSLQKPFPLADLAQALARIGLGKTGVSLGTLMAA